MTEMIITAIIVVINWEFIKTMVKAAMKSFRIIVNEGKD